MPKAECPITHERGINRYIAPPTFGDPASQDTPPVTEDHVPFSEVANAGVKKAYFFDKVSPSPAQRCVWAGQFASPEGFAANAWRSADPGSCLADGSRSGLACRKTAADPLAPLPPPCCRSQPGFQCADFALFSFSFSIFSEISRTESKVLPVIQSEARSSGRVSISTRLGFA